MKIGFKNTAFVLLSLATVFLSISTMYYAGMYLSYRDGYVHVVLEATENILKIDKDLTEQSTEELNTRIDATLDWYMTRVHGLSQRRPDLLADELSYERVTTMASEAGYDLSGEELAGIRGEVYEYTPNP